MAEDLLKDFRMLAGLQPERGEGVPEIVEPDVWKVDTLEERLEVPRGDGKTRSS